MRKISLLLALVASFTITQAHADFTAKNAAGTTITFKNSGDCTAVVCVPLMQLGDGTNTAAIVTAGADAVSNTQSGMAAYSRMQIYNGTTWDRWQGAIKAASGAFASGSIASGAIASGAVASGAYASGSIASGAYASGSIASGAMVDLGAQADAACASDNGSCSLIALQKRGNQNISTLNTTAGAAATLAAATTGGASTTGNIAANNTTAVVIKASAGTLYGVQLYGIGSAPAYLKIYNATSATCGSGTPVKRLMIPAASTAANGAGSNISFGDIGVAFGTGITYCVTTGITDADTTAPAASTFLVNIDFK